MNHSYKRILVLGLRCQISSPLGASGFSGGAADLRVVLPCKVQYYLSGEIYVLHGMIKKTQETAKSDLQHGRWRQVENG